MYVRDNYRMLKRRLSRWQMTISQIVYDNERSFGYSDDDIQDKVIPHPSSSKERYVYILS